MKYKVRIKQAPMQKARTGMQVDYGLYNDISSMGGADARSTQSEFATTRTITGVPRDEANLEAEGGETVYGDLNGDGMPEQNTIKGPRHSEGGVPLNLPEGTFIFSDTKSMKIKDCEILQMFNKPCGKKSYTPADLAKVFDLNAYREILQDPNSDKLDVRTAERMLKNYTIKLGALALAQESMKGFPQGIPAVAEPYMMAAGISAEEVLPPPEMTKLKDSIEKDIQSREQQQMPPAEDVQQAMEMNQGRPVAMPTEAPQQDMAQMQPQEMLGQPMPGMMPPQEQMMEPGGPVLSKRDARRMSKGKPVNMLNYPTKYNQPHSSQVYGFNELKTINENGDFDSNTMSTGVVANTFPDGTSNIQYRGSQDGKPYTYNTDDDFAYYDGKRVDVRPELNESIAGMVGYMPEQKLGGYMELGGYDMPFVMAQGGYAPTQRVRIKELPKADNGRIVIDEDKYPNRYEYEQAIFDAMNAGKTVYNSQGQKLSEETLDRAIKWNEDWDPNQDYAKLYGTEDSANPGQYTMTDDQKLIAANMYLTEKYFNEPKTKALLAKKIREAAADPQAYINKSGSATGSTINDIIAEAQGLNPVDDDGNPITYSSIDDISDDVLINALMSQNKQAAKIKARGISPKAFIDSATGYKSDSDIIAANITDPVTGELVDTPAKVAALKNHYKDLGVVGNNLRGSFESSMPGLEQVAYLGFKKAAFDKSNYAAGSDDAFAARYIQTEELGEGDEPSIYGSKTTTPIDFFEGNTDLGQTALAQLTDFTWDDVPPEEKDRDCLCPDPDNPGEFLETERDENGDCICSQDRIIPKEAPPADWWLQDTINTFGALGDASMIQKQQPWDSPVDLRAPRARYDDPTKELDSNLGLFRQTADTLAQFAGPQGLTSRLSQARGQAAKQAADISKRYNSRNLALANAQEVRAADIANKEAMMNRQINKGLYDATMLADDRFNREKMAARVNRRKLYTQAITNRAQTQALNQLYPDFAVDPSTGGFMYHTPNQRSSSPTRSQNIPALIQKYKDMGMDDKDAIAAAKAEAGFSGGSGGDSATGASVLGMHSGYRSPMSIGKQKGGPVYVYGSNVFPF